MAKSPAYRYVLAASLVLLSVLGCRKITGPERGGSVKVQPSGEAGSVSEILLDVNDVSVLLPLPTFPADRKTLGTPMLAEFIGEDRSPSAFDDIRLFSSQMTGINQMKVGDDLVPAGAIKRQVQLMLTRPSEIDIVTSMGPKTRGLVRSSLLGLKQLKELVQSRGGDPVFREPVLAALGVAREEKGRGSHRFRYGFSRGRDQSPR